MSRLEVTPRLQDPSKTGSKWSNSLANLAGVGRVSAFDVRLISHGAPMLPPLSAILCVPGAMLAAAHCPVVTALKRLQWTPSSVMQCAAGGSSFQLSALGSPQQSTASP